MKISYLPQLNVLDESTKQALFSDYTNPFLSYEFLSELEEQRCVDAESGWQPHHILIEIGDLMLLLPSYIKTHSWGEYVFDWTIADAYSQLQQPYYPKLISAIPFTPIPCNKFIANRPHEYTESQLINLIRPYITEHIATNNMSGWHYLFSESEILACPLLDNQLDASEPLNQRTGVQFHWHNQDYHSFDDYLADMSSRKRKNIKKERAKVTAQNIVLTQVLGTDISDEMLEAFYPYYQSTYQQRGHTGYLSLDFLKSIVQKLPDNILLVTAKQEEQWIGFALYFFDQTTLYGRYWGGHPDFDHLHFEACYYQGIEFCIKNRLEHFNPGTQGEHKIARGFLPAYTFSYHHLSFVPIQSAFGQFCTQEALHIKTYFQQCASLSPFKGSSQTNLLPYQ